MSPALRPTLLAPLPALAFAALVFALQLAWIALLDHAGALPAPVAALWGQAIATAEGAAPLGRVLSTYPPLPLLLAAGWQWAAGLPGLPAPAMVACGLGALLAVGWRAALARAGLGPAAATIGALLLALHPFALWLVAWGPGPVLALIAQWAMAVGLVRLRRRGAPPDAALAAMALAVLGFADPGGMLLAAAALPVLALSAPPDMLGRSALGVAMVLLFPLAAGLAGAAFLALLFGGDPAAPFAGFAASLGAVLDTDVPLPVGEALLALLAGVPVILAPVLLGWRMAPLRAVAIALAALPLLALVLVAATGAPAAPLPFVAPALAVGAAATTLLARELRRPRLALGLLAAGALGGLAAMALLPEDDLDPMRAAIARGHAPPTPDAAGLAALARATAGRTGIAADIAAAPALIAARGTAAGLIGPDDPRFALATGAGRLDTPYVAVRAPALGAPADRVNTAFPSLHAAGLPGYRLLHEAGPWRLYARQGGYDARRGQQERPVP